MDKAGRRELNYQFLDVLVKRERDGSFTTTVYRKETHSDRYLHFSSNHPLQHKLSGLTTLMFRAYRYCSNDELLRAELDHLRKTFIDNGYPEELVSTMFNKTPDEVDSEKVGGGGGGGRCERISGSSLCKRS